MKVPFSWLKKHVGLTAMPAQIADDLVRLGHEVEGVEEPRAAVKGVKIGLIQSKTLHPGADRLSLLKVDIGETEPLGIVCGASNMDEGDKIPVATIGTLLPNGLKIRKGKIRGEVSYGMCCSEAELGLAADAAGLLILPDNAPIGVEIGEYLGLEEAVFNLSITPNRGDCMSVRGLARDLAADAGLSLVNVEVDDVSVDATINAPVVSVSMEHDCPVYMVRSIENISVADSPAWMQAWLIMAGIRPVNGIVDVLSYIMLDLGQPMHAFDADKLSGSRRDDGMAVRSATSGEAFVALDGRELKLNVGDLVVTDSDSVVALAGIMGSESSGVSEVTTHLLLESAFFRPARISETRRSYGMVSEASMRFERGVDPAMVAVAMEWATAMITKLFGGTASSITAHGDTGNINTGHKVACSVSHIASRLGIDIPVSVDDALERMGFGISRKGDRLSVTVPPFRHDVSIPEDISEEYARVIGFDSIPEILPPLAVSAPVEQDRSIHDAVASGFVQVVAYAFVSASEQRLFTADDGTDIELMNPISDAMSTMRRSVWPGLLSVARYNLNRQQAGVALAEQGRIYLKADAGYDEINMLAWLMAGEVHQDEWFGAARVANFFDLKGVVERWLALRRLAGRFITDDSIQGLQAGQSAKILVGRVEAGRIGKVDDDIAAEFNIEVPVFVADINLDALPVGKNAKFAIVPEFPSVDRDLVFLFDRGVLSDAILNAVRSIGGKLLVDVRIFDMYEGKGVPEGKISLGIRFVLQDTGRTLTQKDSDAASDAIIAVMDKRFGASLRG